MYDFIFRHKKLIQVLLFLMFIPFAFFWVGDYVRDAGPGVGVAKVGDQEITREEFNRALRERQQVLQNAAEGRIAPELLDSPQVRQAALDGLVQRRLLLDRAVRSGITVTEAQIDRVITEAPLFRGGDGKFSQIQAEEYLRSENMTAAGFRARLRQDALIQQLSNGIAGTGFVPRTVVARLARLAEQSREVSYATLSPERFLAQVKIAPDAAKRYYDANPAEFRVPEQVRVEYVVLSIESLMSEITPDPEEVRKTYESSRSQYGVEESRQAAHILITADPAAGGKEKARARAEAIYGELQKKPAGFADAAKKHSQDPGSAARGGDLGYISRGMMADVPEFEAAAFKLKAGEISPPVESKLGFHIIRVSEVRPATVKPFEEVRSQIENEIKKQQASRRFAELGHTFTNVVYEQSESLKPAAELIKAPIRQSGWISRARAEPPLDNSRLLGAIFSDETLKDRRNTEAIEVASGQLVSARLLERKAASTRPFEEARAAIETRLTEREAARLAAEEGRQLLDAVRQGTPVRIDWSAPLLVTREGHKDLPEPVLRQAFRMDAAKVPAYDGLESPRGAYVLLRVSRVQEAGDIPPDRIKALAEQLRLIRGSEVLTAYVDSLKQQGGVTINREAFDTKDDGAPASGPAPQPPRRGVF